MTKVKIEPIYFVGMPVSKEYEKERMLVQQTGGYFSLREEGKTKAEDTGYFVNYNRESGTYDSITNRQFYPYRMANLILGEVFKNELDIKCSIFRNRLLKRGAFLIDAKKSDLEKIFMLGLSYMKQNNLADIHGCTVGEIESAYFESTENNFGSNDSVFEFDLIEKNFFWNKLDFMINSSCVSSRIHSLRNSNPSMLSSGLMMKTFNFVKGKLTIDETLDDYMIKLTKASESHWVSSARSSNFAIDRIFS